MGKQGLWKETNQGARNTIYSTVGKLLKIFELYVIMYNERMRRLFLEGCFWLNKTAVIAKILYINAYI